MNTITRRRGAANGGHDQARRAKREMVGLIAVAAAAVTGAAVLFLVTTRTGREARARFQDGDLLRRWQDTMMDLERLAQHGAAYVERKAGELRHAIGEQAGMLEARLPKSR
ncbi:MAG TPA: hypothetical protein VFX14_04450 [Methylomirabilota bacterium]|nr:hypothetical protein [Methylomirabilota bacterium]